MIDLAVMLFKLSFGGGTYEMQQTCHYTDSSEVQAFVDVVAANCGQ